MSTLAIDTYKLLSALKGTGKSANFTAEEIANAVNVAQDDAQLLTKSDFVVGIAEFESRMAGFDVRMDKLDVRMDKFNARMDKFESRMDGFDAKLDLFRADIKAEVKSSQLQNLFWLSGIVLASNGMVIALLARVARVI
jgi:hypothetical protein